MISITPLQGWREIWRRFPGPALRFSPGFNIPGLRPDRDGHRVGQKEVAPAVFKRKNFIQ